jgi:hypothetical protein
MTIARPASAVPEWIPWVGFACLAAASWLVARADLPIIATLAILITSFSLPVLLLDVWHQRRLGSVDADPTLGRYIPQRLSAGAVVVGVWLILLWLLPWANRTLLEPAMQAFAREPWAIGLLLAMGLLPIFTTRLPASDGSVRFGAMLMGEKGFDFSGSVKSYLLGWTVKGFFLPLMAMFAAGDIDWMRHVDVAMLMKDFGGQFDLLLRLTYFFDVMIALGGYLLTFRWSGTHIRSAEPTVGGWVVCLLCYPPFWPAFYDNFFTYEGGRNWRHWLWNNESLLTIGWGSAILILGFIYLQPHPSRHSHQWSLPLHQTSGLSLEKPVLVDDLRALPPGGRCRTQAAPVPDAGRGQSGLFPARQNRGTPSSR